uniref:C2H2-type domain-containing protein n=1 Tax=Kryptolebias marmoratus TaxID=37003 RepID=A0A3Q3AR83_KRYMA
ARLEEPRSRLTCRSCQRAFPTQASFRLHMEITHGQAPQPRQPRPQQPRPGGSQELGWGSGLDLTLMQEQGLDPRSLVKARGREGSSDAAKPHVCNQCGRSYRHASSLLNHKNSHKTGTFFCSSCQKEFPNLMSLKNHRRIHTEPKRYQCPDCGKSFRVSTQLICHRRIHTKEKPFSCQHCDKRFSSKSNLRPTRPGLIGSDPRRPSSVFETVFTLKLVALSDLVVEEKNHKGQINKLNQVFC